MKENKYSKHFPILFSVRKTKRRRKMVIYIQEKWFQVVWMILQPQKKKKS